MGAFEKKICLPLLCAGALFFVAARGCARAIDFFPVSHVLHQNETTAG
jgi:hypothetical protein